MNKFWDRIKEPVSKKPSSVAFAQGRHRLTFAGMAAAIECNVTWLKAHGVEKQDRVCVLSRNRVESVAMEWATYQIEGVWIGLPSREGEPGNLKAILEDFSPTLFLYEIDAVNFEEIKRVCRHSQYSVFIDPPPLFDRLSYVAVRPGKTAVINGRKFRIGKKDIVRIRYTSGVTSGEPKAIAYTEQISLAIIDNIEKVILNKLRDVKVVVHTVPVVWATGSLIAPTFRRGWRNVLLSRWKLDDFVMSLAAEKNNHVLTFLTPGLVQKLARYTIENGKAWFPKKLSIIVAGSPLPVSIAKRALDAFPRGVKLFTSLGQTEASFPITWHRVLKGDCYPANRRNYFIPLGKLTEPYKCSIDDSKNLSLQGKAVALGRWNHEERTWNIKPNHLTGDLVRRENDGMLHYIGREGIPVNGPAPEAIEGVINECPGVIRSRLDYCGNVSVLTVRADTNSVNKSVVSGFFEKFKREANLQNFVIKYIRMSNVPLTMSGKVSRTKFLREAAGTEVKDPEPCRPKPSYPSSTISKHAPESWENFDFSQLSRAPLYYYVGAGLSQAAGFISWEEMADLVHAFLAQYEEKADVNKIEDLHQRENLLHKFVAEMNNKNSETLGRTALLNIMLRYRRPKYSVYNKLKSDDFGFGRPGREPLAEDLALQSLLWKSRPHGVLTTNYDMLLEHAYSLYAHGAALRSYGYNARFLKYVLSNPCFVLKIHGDINDIQGMKFSPKVAWTKEFGKVITDRLIRLYNAILRRGHIVYVGCGFSDYTIQSLEKGVKGTNPHCLIALMPAGDAEKARREFPSTSIRFLTYPQDHHEEVRKFLQRIVDVRSGSEVTDSWHPCLEARDIYRQIFLPSSTPIRLVKRISTKEWDCTVEEDS